MGWLLGSDRAASLCLFDADKYWAGSVAVPLGEIIR